MKIKEGIIVSVVSALLLSTFYFVVNIHDAVNYKLPQKDLLQDTAIIRLQRNSEQQLNFLTEKNKNTQNRINKLNDNYSKIDQKLNKIIDNQKEFNRQQKFIFKTVKELKPYSDFLTEKKTQ